MTNHKRSTTRSKATTTTLYLTHKPVNSLLRRHLFRKNLGDAWIYGPRNRGYTWTPQIRSMACLPVVDCKNTQESCFKPSTIPIHRTNRSSLQLSSGQAKNTNRPRSFRSRSLNKSIACCEQANQRTLLGQPFGNLRIKNGSSDVHQLLPIFI